MHVYLEITNICNCACSFCPGTKREKRFASLHEIRSRLEKIRFHAEQLYLHVMGEPLLHPEFGRIISLCEEFGIPVNLTTNGTLLDQEKQKILLSSPIFRQINFSLQALEEKDLPLLDRIMDFTLSALDKRPLLYINLRMWDLNSNYTLPPKDQLFLDRIYERLTLERPQTFSFEKQKRSLPLKGRLYLHSNDLFQWPVQTVKKTASVQEKVFCHGLLRQIAILVDGTVVPCCLDSEGIMDLGNLDNETLEEILSSPRAEKIRSGFRNGTAAEELCAKCSYRSTHVAPIRRGVISSGK